MTSLRSAPKPTVTPPATASSSSTNLCMAARRASVKSRPCSPEGFASRVIEQRVLRDVEQGPGHDGRDHERRGLARNPPGDQRPERNQDPGGRVSGDEAGVQGQGFSRYRAERRRGRRRREPHAAAPLVEDRLGLAACRRQREAHDPARRMGGLERLAVPAKGPALVDAPSEGDDGEDAEHLDAGGQRIRGVGRGRHGPSCLGAGGLSSGSISLLENGRYVSQWFLADCHGRAGAGCWVAKRDSQRPRGAALWPHGVSMTTATMPPGRHEAAAYYFVHRSRSAGGRAHGPR